jgi:hypothetical protein
MKCNAPNFFQMQPKRFYLLHIYCPYHICLQGKQREKKIISRLHLGMLFGDHVSMNMIILYAILYPHQIYIPLYIFLAWTKYSLTIRIYYYVTDIFEFHDIIKHSYK